MATSPTIANNAPRVSGDSKLDQPLQARTVVGGCLSLVVLGASGDLAKKKTFPAIFNLYKQVRCALVCINLSCLVRNIAQFNHSLREHQHSATYART